LSLGLGAPHLELKTKKSTVNERFWYGSSTSFFFEKKFAVDMTKVPYKEGKKNVFNEV